MEVSPYKEFSEECVPKAYIKIGKMLNRRMEVMRAWKGQQTREAC